jgi:hypothetical protein
VAKPANGSGLPTEAAFWKHLATHTVSRGQLLKQSGIGEVSGGQHGMSSPMSAIEVAAGAAAAGIGAIKGALNNPSRASATSVRARSVRNAMAAWCHFAAWLKRPYRDDRGRKA